MHSEGKWIIYQRGWYTFIFDSGQVLRGLLAGYELVPGALDAARRVADYLCGQMVSGGKAGFGNRYSGTIPENVHIYVLPPLFQAAEVLQRPECRLTAEKCLEFYRKDKDTLRMENLTHFLGYELEGLINLDRMDMVMPVLEKIRAQQKADGSLRGMDGVRWICSPGLAQMAICWYKVGLWDSADKALEWLEVHQKSSGGFLGSYGPRAAYFPDVELSWVAKFYLDAHRLRVLSFMERNVVIFPEEIKTEDGRVQAVLSTVRPGDRILEVGCGKGRFLKAIKSVQPDTECTGVDISPTMLSCLPVGIERLEGSLEQVPCPEDGFDVVFSVEAIEHSDNVDAAVKEMIRIAKPGGWVIIVDKQKNAWGRLACPPWESLAGDKAPCRAIE